MSNNKNEPAFASDISSETGSVGLTKREYFAGLAMQGWIASFAGLGEAPNKITMAKMCVEYADALLIQLEK